MDIIHLLPDSVANQIAAGEVIQRPASCLKELVENSLDAGATRIQVIVRDAGRTLLQVIDDGCGMSETDARMAFERHATSKIATAQDLFALRTMGFRGEALASICAVAQVEVMTRRKEDEVGTLLEIHGSEVLRQEPCQCPVGTNFKVKNLFFNVPVRRKFLKKDQTELRNLLTEFYHIALVYPKVQFTFVHNDEILMELPVGTEKQRIEAIFGKSGSKAYTGQFVDVATDTELVSIRGFIGKPEAATKNAQQYFFVNGRYMRHPYFHKAIMTAYSGMLAGETNPSYFIYFDVAPETIDVNIHPTKTEIKFEDEQMIFQILMAAVRESLGKFNLTPSLDFNREGEIEMPTGQNEHAAKPHVVFDPNYNPFSRSSKPSVQGWEKLYTPLDSHPATYDQHPATNIPRPTANDPQLQTIDLQLSAITDYPSSIYKYNKYLFLPTTAGLMLVHYRRAHIKILFEQYLRQMTAGKGVSQQLLFPEVIDLSADEMVLMATVADELRHAGFELDQFSKNAYSVSGIPALLNAQEAQSALKNILHTVRETGASVTEQWRKQIALSLAKDSAIPYSKNLTDDEAKHLLDDLFALSDYRLTPDGKTICVLLSEDDLARKFS